MSNPLCVFEWRYGSEDMRKIFSIENIVKTYIRVEVALMKGFEEAGLAPAGCSQEVSKCIDKIEPMEIYRLESITGHELFSLASAMSEKCGECGKFVHLGATSNDIIDTAWALIIKDSLKLIKCKLVETIFKLIDLTQKHVDTPVVGRTHGQHATPITFGFKFANYAYELERSFERIKDVEDRVIRLKISGSVGTMASWGEDGFVIEEVVSKELGLKPHYITTQVAPRDGFAELTGVLAILASQLDRFALEIRELSRTEIAEIYESTERVGSSVMPHKKNPVLAERISGLAKVARSLAVGMFENVVLMHERDLTNSSCERIVIPHLFLTIDQMLEDTLTLVNNLRIDEARARANMWVTKGSVFSEVIVMELVKKGLSRSEAYSRVREIVGKTMGSEDLALAIVKDPFLSRYITLDELKKIMTPEYTNRAVGRIVNRTVNYVKEKIREERHQCKQ